MFVSVEEAKVGKAPMPAFSWLHHWPEELRRSILLSFTNVSKLVLVPIAVGRVVYVLRPPPLEAERLPQPLRDVSIRKPIVVGKPPPGVCA